MKISHLYWLVFLNFKFSMELQLSEIIKRSFQKKIPLQYLEVERVTERNNFFFLKITGLCLNLWRNYYIVLYTYCENKSNQIKSNYGRHSLMVYKTRVF